MLSKVSHALCFLMLIVFWRFSLAACVLIRTTGFSHLRQNVPSQRLKSTAINFHVHVHIGSNKTESGPLSLVIFCPLSLVIFEADFPSQKATEL